MAQVLVAGGLGRKWEAIRCGPTTGTNHRLFLRLRHGKCLGTGLLMTAWRCRLDLEEEAVQLQEIQEEIQEGPRDLAIPCHRSHQANLQDNGSKRPMKTGAGVRRSDSGE